MKSLVVWLSIKVAVSSVFSTVILIFMLSLLSGDNSVCGSVVGGGLVGVGDAAVGGEVGVGVTEIGDGCVGVEAGTQAEIKMAVRTNTII
jgi:hypothetical protein